MKLVKYKDAEGKLHYYEPTERKNELIRKREAGEITEYDINSYRNAAQYDKWKDLQVSNRDEIKSDIDTLLPSCRSYDELLFRLRELGYIVNDKKKNGEWLAHISFQAPSHNKATREDKLGDGSFYIRTNLEAFILEQQKEKNVTLTIPHGEEFLESSVEFFENYEYGKTDINKIDDNYKAVILDDKISIESRTEAEKKVISDIRLKDKDIKGLIDTSQIEKLVNDLTTKKSSRRTSKDEIRAQQLVAQIQESFRCLKYIEQHNIYSYEQIVDMYMACKSKYDASVDNFLKVEKAIGELKNILTLPDKASELRERIKEQKGELSQSFEYDDVKMLESYDTLIVKYKIDTPQGYSALKQKVDGFEMKQNENRIYMANVLSRMSELENCINTFNRIDTEQGTPNQEAMKKFNDIKGQLKQNSPETSKNERKLR